MATTPRPSRATTVWRGVTLRCARCGSGHILKHWFSLVDDCPKCGLHFEREQGYWVGALAIHFVLTGGAMILTLAAILVATIPEIPVVPTIAVLIAEVLVIGTLTAPFSRTIWVAVDRAFMQRLDNSERPDEQVRH
jgi:uncharacterized protein (DUF983 family)